ncbi:MAG: PDZ domain-containing protein [Pirellulaceae bacterium]
MNYQHNTRRRLGERIRAAGFATGVCGILLTQSLFAQNPIEDRLSPGNGPDWADPSTIRDGNPARDGRVNPPTADQAWYRGTDGRFFYRDGGGNQVFEQDVYGPRQSAMNQQRPLLGVSLEDSAQGLRIRDVRSGTAAEQAGLQSGDIINSFGDRQATNSTDFVNRVGAMRPGDPIPMTITRDGAQQDVNATLGTAPVANNIYQMSKPVIRERNSFDSTRMQSDIDQLRSDYDQLRRDFDSFRSQGLPETSRGDGERASRALETR